MAVKDFFQFLSRTKIIFGPGQASETGKYAEELGGTKAMILTGKIVGKSIAKPVIESMQNSSIEVVGIFDEIPPDSDLESATKCYNWAIEEGVDIVISVGGGSIIDTAKGMDILLTEGGDLLKDHQGTYLLKRPLKPHIAIPTTSGTGSEVTFASVLNDRKNKIKVTFISEFLAPDVAILDPNLTLDMPKGLTGGTAMDAMSHAIESIHSVENEPIADGLAFYAIRLINDNLRTVIEDPHNLEARSNMLLASTLAGIAFSNTMVGIVHSTAHACGGLCDVPHGMANSILLPYCMEYNLDEAADRYKLVAEAMRIDTTGLSDEEAGTKAIEALKKLTKDAGIPQKLSEFNVKKEDIPQLIELTLSDATIYTNPKYPAEDEVREILEKAL